MTNVLPSRYQRHNIFCTFSYFHHLSRTVSVSSAIGVDFFGEDAGDISLSIFRTHAFVSYHKKHESIRGLLFRQTAIT